MSGFFRCLAALFSPLTFGCRLRTPCRWCRCLRWHAVGAVSNWVASSSAQQINCQRPVLPLPWPCSVLPLRWLHLLCSYLTLTLQTCPRLVCTCPSPARRYSFCEEPPECRNWSWRCLCCSLTACSTPNTYSSESAGIGRLRAQSQTLTAAPPTRGFGAPPTPGSLHLRDPKEATRAPLMPRTRMRSCDFGSLSFRSCFAYVHKIHGSCSPFLGVFRALIGKCRADNEINCGQIVREFQWCCHFVVEVDRVVAVDRGGSWWIVMPE